MNFLKAILYGIIEGITEWLPISSTGHLIVLDEVFDLKVSSEFKELFLVVIQLGAVAAVALLYWDKLYPFSKKKTKEQNMRTWSLWIKVIVAMLPSALIGLLLDDWMDAHLYNYITVALTLLIYGFAFIYVEYRNRNLVPKIRSVGAIDLRTALLIGCFQCLSLVPGTSRSGSTILGAMLLGTGRAAAAEFSFFLAIPTILGASFLKTVKLLISGVSVSFGEVAVLLVGCVVAFAVSFIVIKKLMEFIRRSSFSVFGVYRIALGTVLLLYFLFSLL